MSGNLVETLVGAMVLLVAGFSLTTRFVKVGGVKTGNNVVLAGIKVGAVTDQSPDSNELLAGL